MIGPRFGPRVMPRVGARVGLLRGSAPAGPEWTVDEASGLAFPSTDAEEAAFLAANPTAGPAATLIYPCQEASGDLVEAGGGLSLEASGSVSYQNAVTGYTRKAVGLPDNGPNTGFLTTDASLPNPASSNYLMLVVAKSLGTPAAGRGFLHLSEDNQIRVNTTPRLRMLLAGDDRVVAMNLDTSVHFYFAAVDEANDAAYAGWEDVLTNAVYTSPASATKKLAIGAFDSVSFACHVLAAYVWLGTIPTKAQLKARLQAHGKTVAWSP